MPKYDVVKEGPSEVAYSFVVADGCCGCAVHSYSNGDILSLT